MSVLLHYWQMTLALVAGFVLTLVIRSPFLGSRPRLQRRHLCLLSPLALTVLILLWGAVMEASRTSQALTPSWPGYVILALLVVQFLVSIWVVRAMKGYRWFSVFAVALELWFGLASAFVAGMSVTGDWL